MFRQRGERVSSLLCGAWRCHQGLCTDAGLAPNPNPLNKITKETKIADQLRADALAGRQL
jgi:hypothetical protein